MREVGLNAEILLVDLAERVLTPVHPEPGVQIEVVGTWPAGPTSSRRS